MSAEPRRPSLAELTQALVDAIRAAEYEDELTADAAIGQVTLTDGSRVVLDHLYEPLAAASPEERAEMLGRMARQLVRPATLPPTWAEAQERIRLQAKPNMAFEADALRREAGHPVPKVHFALLTPHLALEMVIPVRDGVLNIPVETLAAWGVTVEQAFDAARRNDDADAARPWLVSAKHPGMFCSPWQDGRDGARLINPRALTLPLHGRAVAVLPTPSMLLVAGSDDEQGRTTWPSLHAKRFSARTGSTCCGRSVSQPTARDGRTGCRRAGIAPTAPSERWRRSRSGASTPSRPTWWTPWRARRGRSRSRSRAWTCWRSRSPAR